MALRVIKENQWMNNVNKGPYQMYSNLNKENPGCHFAQKMEKESSSSTI
jgi:hypothetical protein